MVQMFYITVSLSVSAPLVEADKETDEQNYLLWRIENGVAEGSTEIPKGTYCKICFLVRETHSSLADYSG